MRERTPRLLHSLPKPQRVYYAQSVQKRDGAHGEILGTSGGVTDRKLEDSRSTAISVPFQARSLFGMMAGTPRCT